MHIQNRTAMGLLNLAIGVVAALATWIQFINFGNDAWRFLATWVALLAAVYYIPNALVTLFAKRRPVGTELCPMLQGTLIIAGITLMITFIVCYAMDSYIPVVAINVILIDFILPIAMVVSWVMFSEKGRWRAYDPFYWLGLIAAYASIILFTGEFMSRTARYVYPYEFFDYPAIGIDIMLWWFAILAVVILAVGFVFWILDFIFSGHLSKHVVMPKIKTYVVEEEIDDENLEDIDKKPEEKSKESEVNISTEEKPEEKPVKLVTTGGRNVLPAHTETQVNEHQTTAEEKPNKTSKKGSVPKDEEGVDVAKKEDLEVDAGKTTQKNEEKTKKKDRASNSSEKTQKQPTDTPVVRIIERVEVDNDSKTPEKESEKSKPPIEAKASEKNKDEKTSEKKAKSDSETKKTQRASKSESQKSKSVGPESKKTQQNDETKKSELSEASHNLKESRDSKDHSSS